MRYLVMLFAFIASISVQAQLAETYKEGEHYLPLATPVPTIVGKDKVEVTEIFRFGCGACYNFEKNLKTWKESKPAQAELVKNPVVWNDATKIRAAVFLTGQKLGIGDEVGMAIFKGIHEATSRKEADNAYLKDEDVLALFESLGADKEAAKKTYKGWFIQSKVRQADGRAKAFAINGTPEIFVDGRYRITVDSAGGFDNMLKVASYLVEKVAAERGI